MKPTFHPRLINDPFSDPTLFIPFAFKKRALLFDLGDLGNLSPRDLLKVSHVFVTHTHIDHFIGFDQILRILLGREKELHLFGPPDFFQRIEGKLTGYTWNLVDEYETDFRLKVTEVYPKKCITQSFACRNRFKPFEHKNEYPFTGTLLEEAAFKVTAEWFDHRIPVLGFSLVENFHININKEALKELGLPVGPWINRFKKAVYENQDQSSEFIVSFVDAESNRIEKAYLINELSAKIAHISAGTKITYLTDMVGDRKNIEKAIKFAEGSDQLFIEASFMDCDKDVARKKYHLTAKQAGEIAGKAGVKQLIPFHFSPRYSNRSEELIKEALEEMKREEGRRKKDPST